MKILSVADGRLKDRRCSSSIPTLDVDVVRANLKLITERVYDRGEDLDAKLKQALHLRAGSRTIPVAIS